MLKKNNNSTVASSVKLTVFQKFVVWMFFPAICLSYAILASPVDRGWMILCFSQTELFSLGVAPVSALNGKIIKAKSFFIYVKAVANQWSNHFSHIEATQFLHIKEI